VNAKEQTSDRLRGSYATASLGYRLSVGRRAWRRMATFGLIVLSLCALSSFMASSASAACGNPVQCENQLPGDPPSDWQVSGAGDSTIQGFATSMSVNVGQTESFKIKTPSTSYHIDILRLGYYGGDGARMIQAGIKGRHRADRLRQLGRVGLVDGSVHRRVGRLHRSSRSR